MLTDDIEAAYDYITTVLCVPTDKIILHSRSMGSGPTCHLAEKLSKRGERFRGLILQSPLLSIYRVAFVGYRYLVLDLTITELYLLTNTSRNRTFAFPCLETSFVVSATNRRATLSKSHGWKLTNAQTLTRSGKLNRQFL